MTQEQKVLILGVAAKLGIHDLGDEEIIMIFNSCPVLNMECIVEKIKELRKPKIEMYNESNLAIDNVPEEVKESKEANRNPKK